MAAACQAQEDDHLSKNLQKRYDGLVTVRTRAIKGKGAWYWLHLEPILFQNQDTGTAKAIKLRCGLCSALFSASNPSRTATEHLKRGTCPNFNGGSSDTNSSGSSGRKRGLLALPPPPLPLAMITAPPMASVMLPSPPRPNLTNAQIETAFDLLADWLYESCGYVSLSSLDHPKFRAFLHHLGLPLVDRTFVSGEKLDSRYAQVKFESEDKLRDAMFFQLSSDGWKKNKNKNNSLYCDSFANISLNLPNGSNIFHKALIVGGAGKGATAKDIEEALWATISELSGDNVYRCAGIISDTNGLNSQALRELELRHHWMVNLTCQSQGLSKLLKDFFKHLPLLTTIATRCFKLIQFFDSDSKNTNTYQKIYPDGAGKLGPANADPLDLSHTFAAIEDLSLFVRSLRRTILSETFCEGFSGHPVGQEISEAVQDARFRNELEAAVSLIRLMRVIVQETEEEKPCLGQCLPLWEELRSRIKNWCTKFSVEENPVMEIVNRRFSKNYHQAWSAAFVLDPLYLVKDVSGKYLPPFKLLTSEQEKDVVKIITRLTKKEEAHIAIMELMKWRTEGLNPVYAQAVQAKETDPITGKLRVANPRSSRLVWETYLREHKVLGKVAARLIFLQATSSGLRWNRSFLSWICSNSQSKIAIERAQKVLFVASQSRMERRDFVDEEGKDAEMFACEDDGILDDFFTNQPAGLRV